MDWNAFLDGFGVVTQPTNLLYCLIGVLIGMLIGVLPGLGPTATMAILLPIAYNARRPGLGDHHARRHLLRSAVRRHDHVGAAPHPRRGQLGGDRLRRLRPGQAGQGRHRARHRRDRLLRRRHRVDHRAHAARPDRRRLRAGLRPAGVRRTRPARRPAGRHLGNGNTVKASSRPRSACCWPPSAATPSPAPTASRSTPSSSRAASTSSSSRWACSASARSSTTSRSGTGSRTCPPRSPTSGPPARTSQAAPAIGRGSVIGFFLGVLPGGGAVMASLASYAAEKRVAKDPSRFGRGAIEGVAGPESANNAAATSSFIPLLTIGIPANASMAMLFAALLVVGVTPGPQLIDQQPRHLLGRHRLDVHRQPHAAGAEHPAGRRVREDPAGPAGDPGRVHRAHHDPGSTRSTTPSSTSS